MSRDQRVDSYIAGKADFARPILEHLRAAVHGACPQVEEAMKWSMPAFVYKGKILAHMAAFKAHAAFGFWNGAVAGAANQSAMGQFGRIESLSDLPDDATLAQLVRKAAALIDQGAKPARTRTAARPRAALPDDFAAALAADKRALDNYQAFSPSAQRDYVDWVVDAKRPETRARRIETAVGWIAEGKKRNWKYESC